MNALKIFSYVMLVLFTFIIYMLISNISNYFEEKSKYQQIINKRESKYSSKLTLPERLNATVDLLTLCSTMIDSEVMRTIQGYMIINSKYDLKRIDTDMELISKSVYDALNKEALLDKDLLLTPEHYLQYINNETFLRLINVVQEYNTSLHNQ